MTPEDEALSKFFTTAPLYKKIYTETNHANINAFQKKTFKYHCKDCKDTHTFELSPFPTIGLYHPPHQRQIGYVEQKYTIANGNQNITQHYKGECTSCRKYTVDMVLNSWVMPNPNVKEQPDRTYLNVVMKIGQFPAFDIKPKPVVYDYLTEEDKGNYSKALMSYSQGYGIGAFSYYRRIVENVLRRIIKETINEDLAHDARASKLIEDASTLLPSSLKDLGFNPISALYDQLSLGLHALSEDVCMHKAEFIEQILSFTIEKISEENSSVKDVKKAFQLLTSS